MNETPAHNRPDAVFDPRIWEPPHDTLAEHKRPDAVLSLRRVLRYAAVLCIGIWIGGML